MNRLRTATRTAQHAALGLTVTFAGLLAASACTSKQSPVGPGGECFLATDCAPGLVCVEQRNQTRICTDDLSSVAGRPPPEAGPMDAGDGGEGGEGVDGESPDVGPPPPPPDGSVPDVVSTPPDSGPPPEDAGDQ